MALERVLTACPEGVVDTHVHLWDPEGAGPKLSWLGDVPKLNTKLEVEEFQAQAVVPDGRPLVGTMVFMETGADMEQSLEELAWVSSIAPKDARLVGAVLRAPVEDAAACRSHVTKLLENPLVKGIRRLIQGNGLGFCNTAEFKAGVGVLAEFGLPFDLCVFHPQLPDVVELVAACPDVTFVLDHLGKPAIKEHELEPWREHISQLAALPNVLCKLSGATTEADHDSWTPADLKPYVTHCVEAFGWDRVVYGGDWPVATLATEYPRFIAALAECLPDATPEQLRKLFIDNARRVYNLGS